MLHLGFKGKISIDLHPDVNDIAIQNAAVDQLYLYKIGRRDPFFLRKQNVMIRYFNDFHLVQVSPYAYIKLMLHKNNPMLCVHVHKQRSYDQKYLEIMT
jgi:hypothetical protein